MANQIVVSSGAKVRDLNDVIIGTSGVLSSLAFNVSNGVPKLDVNGKILVSQLPNSVMEYLGTWNAATNTPFLVNGTGNAGDVYLCNVAGTVDFGAGPITFVVSDQVIYSGSIWQKASGSNGTVTSVAVTESGDSLNITGSPITTSGTINIGFNGTNLQYINGAGDLTTFPTLLSSVGLSMPSAFNVSNSPLTANGTIGVTGAGVASQYIRGDGTLADFPTSGGGGSSVSYYLNGGTSQGVIGGITYYEMSKIAVIGTGVDFPKTGDGLIVSFLTDAGDPAQLNIPAGNWNYEIYASMSANGGTPELYAELYVYDGTTFTLIGTSSNEILYDGTTLNLYTFAMAVPATTLAITDRLAVKLYATNSGGKTTTVHTQDGHLCQIITTFSTGITALNGLTAQVQFFATGTSGTDFAISSSTATHTFNLPTASATNRGALSSADWTTFNNKQSTISLTTTGTSGAATLIGATLNIPNYSSALSSYVPYTGATADVDLGSFDLSAYAVSADILEARLNGTASSPLILRTGTSGFASGLDAISLISSPSSANTLSIISDVSSVTKRANIGLGLLTATRTYTLPDASGTIALVGGSGVGTVTSVAALTLGTTGTDVSSTVANGTTTPVITLNIPDASATARGLITTGTQIIAGAKTFNNVLKVNDTNGFGIGQIAGYRRIQYGTAVADAFSFLSNSDGFADIYFKNAVGTGSLQGTSFIPTGATIPSNGMYLSAANTLNFATNTTNRITITSAGNVGIGGTPVDLLTLNATSTSTVFTLQNGAVTKGLLGISYAVSDLISGSASGDLNIRSNNTNINFSTNNGGTLGMRITSGGNAEFSGQIKTTFSGQSISINAAGTGSIRMQMQNNSIGNAGVSVESSTGGDQFSGTSAYSMAIGTYTARDFFIGTNSVQRFKIDSSGTITMSSLGTGAVTATSGVLSTTSDMNLKIEDGFIDNALDKILKLTPRYFYWKEESKLPTDLRQLGFYAQEVNEALGEEVANTPKDENQNWGIYDRGIIAMLTKGMQEQNELIEDLKARLDNAGL
jgi:hypothetical protein